MLFNSILQTNGNDRKFGRCCEVIEDLCNAAGIGNTTVIVLEPKYIKNKALTFRGVCSNDSESYKVGLNKALDCIINEYINPYNSSYDAITNDSNRKELFLNYKKQSDCFIPDIEKVIFVSFVGADLDRLEHPDIVDYVYRVREIAKAESIPVMKSLDQMIHIGGVFDNNEEFPLLYGDIYIWMGNEYGKRIFEASTDYPNFQLNDDGYNLPYSYVYGTDIASHVKDYFRRNLPDPAQSAAIIMKSKTISLKTKINELQKLLEVYPDEKSYEDCLIQLPENWNYDIGFIDTIKETIKYYNCYAFGEDPNKHNRVVYIININSPNIMPVSLYATSYEDAVEFFRKWYYKNLDKFTVDDEYAIKRIYCFTGLTTDGYNQPMDVYYITPCENITFFESTQNPLSEYKAVAGDLSKISVCGIFSTV